MHKIYCVTVLKQQNHYNMIFTKPKNNIYCKSVLQIRLLLYKSSVYLDRPWGLCKPPVKNHCAIDSSVTKDNFPASHQIR